jgi:hypothetical protein
MGWDSVEMMAMGAGLSPRIVDFLWVVFFFRMVLWVSFFLWSFLRAYNLGFFIFIFWGGRYLG